MQDLNKNQEKSSYGGRRDGAGRPKGATNKVHRNLRNMLQEEITEEQVIDLFKTWFLSGDFKKQLSAIEYLYGKPTQPTDLNMSGDEEFRNILSKLIGINEEDDTEESEENDKSPVSES